MVIFDEKVQLMYNELFIERALPKGILCRREVARYSQCEIFMKELFREILDTPTRLFGRITLYVTINPLTTETDACALQNIFERIKCVKHVVMVPSCTASALALELGQRQAIIIDADTKSWYLTLINNAMCISCVERRLDFDRGDDLRTRDIEHQLPSALQTLSKNLDDSKPLEYIFIGDNDKFYSEYEKAASIIGKEVKLSDNHSRVIMSGLLRIAHGEQKRTSTYNSKHHNLSLIQTIVGKALCNIVIIVCMVLGTLLFSSCQDKQETDFLSQNAIYHWKTTYNPSSWELEFLKRNNIKRMYVHMFDVDVTDDGIVPIATTRFAQPMPDSVEIVPTVYITNTAISRMAPHEVPDYAIHIVQRVKAMTSYNKLGRISEMQIDCDWSKGTRERYFTLLNRIRDNLRSDSVKVSVTLRLHQLCDAAPPVDRATLMLYNTGKLMDAKTNNSILDINDVKPYLRSAVSYKLPLDYAFPTFGWGVKFRQGKFECIVSRPDTMDDQSGIRIEQSRLADILATKSLVGEKISTPQRGYNIIYHLDSLQLSKFKKDEITQIYAPL